MDSQEMKKAILKKIPKLIIFIIPGIIIVVGISMYITHFTSGFSNNSLIWGSFGAFMNPFVTLANVSLFIMFSLLVYKYNKSINRPILTFRTSPINGREIWQIINIGNGPALNLLVAYKHRREDEWVSPAVKSYSLGKGDMVDLDWLDGDVDVIGVYFKDLLNEEFIAVVGDDITEIRSLSSFKSFNISGYKFEKAELQTLLTLDSIRVTRARNNENKSFESTTEVTTSQF